MKRTGTPQLIPIFIAVLILILVIFGIAAIVRSVFFSGQAPVSETTNEGRTALVDTSASNSVRMTARGPIVADESFKSFQIEINQEKRTMRSYSGYLGTVDESRDLDNNQKAYEEFVFALDKANYMKGTMFEEDAKNDVRGICATGYVYEYEVLSGNSPVKRLWTSTCEGSRGSLEASTAQINGLFYSQIPDFEQVYPFNANAGRLRL